VQQGRTGQLPTKGGECAAGTREEARKGSRGNRNAAKAQQEMSKRCQKAAGEAKKAAGATINAAKRQQGPRKKFSEIAPDLMPQVFLQKFLNKI
jgi:hypothetical protein